MCRATELEGSTRTVVMPGDAGLPRAPGYLHKERPLSHLRVTGQNGSEGGPIPIQPTLACACLLLLLLMLLVNRIYLASVSRRPWFVGA